MINCQLVIIGGGSAGMASALKAYQDGVKDVYDLPSGKVYFKGRNSRRGDNNE